MESENKDVLERNVSEKMCSSGSNGAGEICSPGTADTCGDSCSFEKKKFTDEVFSLLMVNWRKQWQHLYL